MPPNATRNLSGCSTMTTKPATPLPWKCLIVGDKEWPAAFDRMLYQYPNGTEIVIRKDSSGGLAQHQVFIRTDERCTVYGLRFEEVQPPRLPDIITYANAYPELVAALRTLLSEALADPEGCATVGAQRRGAVLLAKLGEVE